ncbi:MAG: protease modulator HflC [Kiritimatiellae bacterium]|nr:protease modulator HflC [Kiritimatiellia bacterium]
MKSFMNAFYGFIIFALVVIVANSVYVVQETEQVILTQFGRPVGDAVNAAGLHFRVPFIQKPNSIEKRILAWDGRPNDMPTKDKLYITVDTFARWRISDPLQYFLRLRDERSAQSRLDDILGSETRNAVAKHELIEIIRTSKDRVPVNEGSLGEAGTSAVQWLPIEKGRVEIEKEIFAKAEGKLVDFGIELLDVRFKRINYNPNVREKIYDRMISERMQIASRFRSEGEGEAEIILGNKERDLRKIESEAYKEIQEIMGQADAKATEVYASAYNKSPEAIELYTFVKTLETYESSLDANTTLILTTDSDLFRYLKTAE